MTAVETATPGSRLRALRIARNLNQKDLAAHLGISRASIANIELGMQQLTVANLIGAADLFGVSIGVIAGTEPMPDLPAVSIRLVHAVECTVCGDLGVFDDLEDAKKARREHRTHSGGET